jgi:hypothetical protein
MAKQTTDNPPLTTTEGMADMPATEAVADAIIAADMTTAAETRSPEFPGYEAVQELYGFYLSLGRKYVGMASDLESIKQDIGDIRRGMVNNG